MRLRPFEGHRDPAGDRRAMAHPCDAAKPALFRSDSEERTRPLSRLLLVLLPERACVPLPEHASSARLQYGPAISLLALPSALAVPVERILSRSAQALLQAGRPRGPHAAACALLGGIRYGVLHFFDDARILFDADLSCAGAVAGLRDGDTASMDARSVSKAHRRRCRPRGARDRRHSLACPWPADAGRYLQRSHVEPGGVHAFAWHMGDLTLEVVRLPAIAPDRCGRCVPRRSHRRMAMPLSRDRGDDGAVSQRGSSRASRVRSVPLLARAWPKP